MASPEAAAPGPLTASREYCSSCTAARYCAIRPTRCCFLPVSMPAVADSRSMRSIALASVPTASCHRPLSISPMPCLKSTSDEPPVWMPRGRSGAGAMPWGAGGGGAAGSAGGAGPGGSGAGNGRTAGAGDDEASEDGAGQELRLELGERLAESRGLEGAEEAGVEAVEVSDADLAGGRREVNWPGGPSLRLMAAAFRLALVSPWTPEPSAAAARILMDSLCRPELARLLASLLSSSLLLKASACAWKACRAAS
mmetsp:Transcript_19545/g.49168  ORF Transcript_19545/g.49168 Transcript_19545/m.49168 type:complete len:254 (+) Transcript_19545:449-1210(+)